MTIPEAYAMLGLNYTSDLNELEQKYFSLQKERSLKDNSEAMVQLEVAERIVRNCIIYKEQNKLNIVLQQKKEYEFYEHMYETPKAKIPFEQLLEDEIKLNLAKRKISKYLLSLINNLDDIYNLDKLCQFAEQTGLSVLLENYQNNNRHK